MHATVDCDRSSSIRPAGQGPVFGLARLAGHFGGGVLVFRAGRAGWSI